jgi:hypothetical protein
MAQGNKAHLFFGRLLSRRTATPLPSLLPLLIIVAGACIAQLIQLLIEIYLPRLSALAGISLGLGRALFAASPELARALAATAATGSTLLLLLLLLPVQLCQPLLLSPLAARPHSVGCRRCCQLLKLSACLQLLLPLVLLLRPRQLHLLLLLLPLILL